MSLVVIPRQHLINASAEIAEAAVLYVYDAGTEDDHPAYTTAALSVEHPQPILSDAAGIFPRIEVDPADGLYKLVAKTAVGGVVIWTEDNLTPGGQSDITQAEIDAGVTITNPSIPNPDLMGIVFPRRYGYVGDGTTDDTTALESALLVVSAGQVIYIDGTGIVGEQLESAIDSFDLVGPGTLKAKANTDFSVILNCTNRTKVNVIGPDFDINGANRTSGQTQTLNAISFNGSTDCSLRKSKIRNSRGYLTTSATAVAASGNAVRFVADGAHFIDCGESATVKSSDGLFVRGTDCQINHCIAVRCTDTAFVLEGCNRSQINGCVADDCTSMAAISNDTASDCVGNQINGLTGSNSYVGSTGGTVAVACFDDGDLLDCQVNNVTIRYEDDATNLGPGMQIRTTGTGRVKRLKINSPTIDIGGASGVLAQGILISDSDDVEVNNATIIQDTTAGSNGIRIDGDSTAIVSGGKFIGAEIGVHVLETSIVTVKNVHMKDGKAGGYGIYANDTSVVTSIDNDIEATGLTAIEGKASGATLISDVFQSWTPTFSSDIGNAATTFSGSVTVTEARFAVEGKTARAVVEFSATLNAVTPNYLQFTLPSFVVPFSNNTYKLVDVLNDTTRATGLVRTIMSPPGTNALRVFRNQAAANFSSGVAVASRFEIEFEIA